MSRIVNCPAQVLARFSRWLPLGVLSALLAGGCWPATAQVVINEIMYHPSSEDVREEYVELYNAGLTSVNLAGWRLRKGVEFIFPVVELSAGAYLVIAADVASFTNKHPSVTNVVGGWNGILSNSRNTVNLDDAANNRVDSVTYADEGDWAIRLRAAPDHSHRGWTWHAEHDGFDKSLELINPGLPNESGQNWAASVATNGTPGAANSVAQTNIAPLVLDVQFLPPVPRSVDSVLVSARLVDERNTNLTASLHWLLDGPNAAFTALPMFDDGAHNDGAAGDRVFAATIPPQTNNAIVEFYIEATDQDGLTRTWPAAAIDTNGATLGQQANVLFQVDDSTYGGAQPLYKLIMKTADRLELEAVGSASNGEENSDAEMNGTFISSDATGLEVRTVVGIRNRGHGSRNAKPNNYRVAFVADRLWKGVTAINLNSQYTHAQLIGAVLALKAGVGGANSLPVQVRVDNLNPANNGPQTYGGVYVANEVVNSDWAEHWLPFDSSGNVYRALRDIAPSDFAYRGTNHNSYTNTWFKQTNTSEDKWSDLMGMLRVVGTNDLFSTAAVRQVVNVEQWMNYFAVMALFDNRETSPNRGENDDYILYAGINDPRFILMYYDLDTILGEGSSTTSATNSTIFGATGIPAFDRFLHWPDFEPIYYRTLQHLLDTTFSAAEFDSTVDQTLGDFVPESVRTRMKTWMAGRRHYVQSLIAPYLATDPIPVIATIEGEPRSPTPLTSATLIVGSEGVTQYRFRLNDGAFGAATPVSTPIILTGLANGSTNTVSVIGVGANGIWQGEGNATVSPPWVVSTSWPAVRLNEILADNVSALNHSGTFPDAIELFNEGNATVNLAGLRLSDRRDLPNKFTFPNGTTLAPGACLVVFADNNDGSPGLHSGFSLDANGEGVFLFDRITGGGTLLDAVEFGTQLPDLSIGRVNGAGAFVLTQPSFGQTNVAQPMGDPHQLRINEWLASPFAAANNDLVELFNPELLPVALGGLILTDNPIGEPTKHVVPPLTYIAPNGYRRLVADGDAAQGADHLNFRLAAEQGLIALCAPNLEFIDLVLYGPQHVDVSQGRVPNGGTTIRSLTMPTFGAPNPSPISCAVTSISLSLMQLTNAFWRYNQTNNLDGVNWTDATYDDSRWPSGQALLAFESASAITPLIHTSLSDPRIPPSGLTAGHAYYFRTRLVLSDDLTGFTITGTVRADDGAVIYVNGTEMPRLRMPSGAITNRTLADAQPPGGDAVISDLLVFPASAFVVGTNVISAEVHQESTNSSDVVWGLALDATRSVTNCAENPVVINEVFANNQTVVNAAGRTPDWIELRNNTTNSVDLNDLSLTDDPARPRKWVFPPGTTIAPGTSLVIECDDGLPPSATNTGFAVNASGDALYLFDRPAAGGAALDSISFGVQAADFSLARVPDGSGLWALALPTRASPNVAAALGNASFLKLNEWLANSPGGDDWLEVFNPSPQPVELSGLSLSDNPDVRDKSPFVPFSFIGPRSFLMLRADGNRGAGADHVAFSLDEAGDFLGLYWPIGTQIDALSFGPQSAGVSQGRFPDGAVLFVNFTNSASPGAPNYLPLTNLVINEVLSHTDLPLEDAVEVRNLGATPVDIGGWFLSNSDDELQKYFIPSNTIVPGNGFKVIYEFQFVTNTSPGAAVPFTFNSARGDEAHLSQPDGAGGVSGFQAVARFGPAANGISFGRFLTSVGEEFVAMSARSFGVDNPATLAEFRAGTGSANPHPLVGPVVISEIQFQPTNHYFGDTNAAEFLELLNITSNAVPLFDSNASSNTWKLAGGIEFSFPTNVTLPPHGSLLLVSFDPVVDFAQSNWFCAAYQIPLSTPLFGPWSGALANEGEDLTLFRPDPPQLPPHPDAGLVPYVLVERVQYSPVAPWPTNGLGVGDSLQRNVPSNFGNEPVNWFRGRTSAGRDNNADSDGDGLPDWWERAHNLLPGDPNSINGADGDPDNDGVSNAQEFVAGTDPQSNSSFLHLESVKIATSGVALRFQAAGGRTFSVLYSDGSPSGPWLKLADAPASANSKTIDISDASIGANGRFYRLVSPAWP